LTPVESIGGQHILLASGGFTYASNRSDTMSKVISSDKRGNVIGGLIVIAIGIWFLLDSLEVIKLPSIGRLWPIFPTLAGLAFMAAYFMRSDNEDGPFYLIPGVGAFLTGIFFFFFTFDVFEWAAMGRLWPVFPLIGGIAFSATWLAGGRKESSLLVPVGGALTVGIISLIITLGGFSIALIVNYWPVILIVIGLGILARNLIVKGS
jgi:hypothetical protein